MRCAGSSVCSATMSQRAWATRCSRVPIARATPRGMDSRIRWRSEENLTGVREAVKAQSRSRAERWTHSADGTVTLRPKIPGGCPYEFVCATYSLHMELYDGLTCRMSSPCDSDLGPSTPEIHPPPGTKRAAASCFVADVSRRAFSRSGNKSPCNTYMLVIQRIRWNLTCPMPT
jgi:hypothetical protein